MKFLRRLKRLRKNAIQTVFQPAGAKAPTYFQSLSARLKSYPDTTPVFPNVFPRPVRPRFLIGVAAWLKPCPDTNPAGACKRLLAPVLIATAVALSCVSAWAASERGVAVRPAVIYISPDTSSAKLTQIERGREMAILETTGEWAHVTGIEWEHDVTGWMLNKGIVRASTPNGDKILFGEAVDSESEASRRGGRKGADKDALRLYAMVAEYFPNSPLAGEALYRAADINWQLQAEDIRTRPSARVRDPGLHAEFDEELMKKVERKFPHTKWADLAAFRRLEPKLCGDWEMRSKCPEKEADMYENYAKDHPQSPAAPEALYYAAWRRSALVQIYKLEGEARKAPEAAKRAVALAEQIVAQYPQTDWAARAQGLIFLINQNIQTFGNVVE